MRTNCDQEQHEREGACYLCCPRCDMDEHVCGGCGTPLRHDGREIDGKPHPSCVED